MSARLVLPNQSDGVVFVGLLLFDLDDYLLSAETVFGGVDGAALTAFLRASTS